MEILLIHCNLAILGIWDPIKIIVSIWRKLSCLSVCKKSTSSLTSFLRYCMQTVTIKVSIWRNLCLSAGKKSTSSFPFFLRYCKLVILGTLGKPGYTHPKWYYQLVENFCVYLQKINFIPQVFLKYCKDIQTSYFGYFGDPWLRTSKMIVSTCRKLRYLSACQKWTLSFHSFLRYYILNNLAIWLAVNNLAHNSSSRILTVMELVAKYQ